MTATTDLPAMPVDDDELRRGMAVAILDLDLSPKLRVKLANIVTIVGFCDRAPDDVDREGQCMDHAMSWRVTRQRWREFVVAWRAEHPLTESVTS